MVCNVFDKIILFVCFIFSFFTIPLRPLKIKNALNLIIDIGNTMAKVALFNDGETHGLPNMISGVNSIIFINMLAYPIPLPSILQQSEVLNLPELVTLPDRSKKEKALT